MKGMYKTTIVIWSEFSGEDVELSALAKEAETGNAYCSKYRSELVHNPKKDLDWDNTEFFGEDD